MDFNLKLEVDDDHGDDDDEDVDGSGDVFSNFCNLISECTCSR